MNNNQISAVKKILYEISAFDVDSHLSKIYVNQDITSIRVGQYSLPEYISTTKRLVKQFDIELDYNGIYIPYQYNFVNEGLGNGNLQLDLTNFYNNLKAGNVQGINNSIGFLNRLIYYQIINGFWDKFNEKNHNTDIVEISDLKEQLHFIEKHQKQLLNEINSGINILSKEKSNLEEFIKTKKADLQIITNNLQLSNNATKQINYISTESVKTNEKINSILSQQQQNLEKSNKEFELQENKFKNKHVFFTQLEDQLNEKIKEFENKNLIFSEKLIFVESKTDFFIERNNYLDNLIGKEVGASLFETFKQRKTELLEPVKNWRWIVIGASILTFVAVFSIFSNFFGWIGDGIPTSFTWQQVIVNTLKTSPFFFLLFYAISQYNKERNFQEEYAFKSAVALTIKAYADIIKKEEIKDELIFDSVKAVYKSPTLSKGKIEKVDNEIIGTAKDLISTALNVVRKNV